MLVLTRLVGEEIRVGDDVTITVVECQAGKVRLGFEGSEDVRIVREEVYPAMAQRLAELKHREGNS